MAHDLRTLGLALTHLTDVTGGQATSGTGTIYIPGYAPQNLTLITLATPGIQDDGGGLFGYRANDGTDIFNVDAAFPVDALGILFAIGPNPPAPSEDALFTIYAVGPGAYQTGVFGHIVPDGPEFYTYNINTADAVSAPEPLTLSLFGAGLAGLALVRRRKPERTA